MPENAITVESISKRYRIGERQEASDTLGGAITDFVGRPLRNLRRLRRLSRFAENGRAAADVIWAVKDVSFEVGRGDVVGLIGRNGAGKSTLLKILSRITEPTSGRVVTSGRVASLLEVGTGFHMELTGRENIYLNGTVLGMKRREVERKFEEIVDFSGVEKFIDTPVKRYSSGMVVRLAFAVAAHLEPDILLVDEVLAVGDVAFQQKCLDKMRSVTREGRTILFVSHNMSAIQSLCERTIVVDAGEIVADGATDKSIAIYLDRSLHEGAVLAGESLVASVEGGKPKNSSTIWVKEIALLDEHGLPRTDYRSDEEITVSITYECLKSVSDLRLFVYVVDAQNDPLLVSANNDDIRSHDFYRQEAGTYRATCTVPANLLGEKRFYLTVQLEQPKIEHLILNKILSFDVSFVGFHNNQYRKDVWIRPMLSWSTKSLASEQAVSNE